MNKLFKKLDAVSIAILSILVSVSGYVVLNLYLSDYGFWDFSIFQPRYVTSGLLFFMISFLFTNLMLKIMSIVKLDKFSTYSNLIVLNIVFILIYSKVIFPKLPYYIGGGEPLTVAIKFSKGFENVIPYSNHETIEDYYVIFKLIYQTQDYILLKSNFGVFLVNNDKIASIHYDRNLLFQSEKLGKIMKFVNDASTSSDLK